MVVIYLYLIKAVVLKLHINMLSLKHAPPSFKRRNIGLEIK